MDEIFLQMVVRAIAVLTEALSLIDSRVGRLIGKLDTADGKLVRTQLANAGIAREEIERIMAQIQPELARAMRPDYQRVVEASIDVALKDPQMRRAVSEYAPQIAQDLASFVREWERDIAAEITSIAQDAVSGAIRRAIITGESVESLGSTISSRLGTTAKKSATAIERGVRDLSEETIKRAVEAVSDNVDDEVLYVYTGPNDSVIRDYCRRRQGKALTQDQADALDPAERYNCRHSLAPITATEARRQRIKRMS